MNAPANFYLLGFWYPGPYSNFAECDEANDQLISAERTCRKVLEELCIPYRSEYTWPDGSLYVWVKTHEDLPTVVETINQGFQSGGSKLHVQETFCDAPRPTSDFFQSA
jgi:hypothetical protein